VVHRLPAEQQDLLELVEGFAVNEVAPKAAGYEAEKQFPRPFWDQMAAMDLTGLPFDAALGGAELPYRTYLMVVEELARAHLAIGLGLSVHTLATWGIANHATDEQRATFVPDMVAGRLLGAYALSEPDSGSDAAALRTRATKDGEVYRINGTKAWVTHGGIADRYLVMARTGADGSKGISAFVVDRDQEGLSFAPPEHKMGMRASPTSQLVFEDAPVGADRRVGGEEGSGFSIAMASLDGGRLGISACAVGVAQAALDAALAYARQREQFGRPIIEFQGLSFMLADMATQVEAARALYRSAVERHMREAKVLQIVEGTNQIQRLVIGRRLATGR